MLLLSTYPTVLTFPAGVGLVWLSHYLCWDLLDHACTGLVGQHSLLAIVLMERGAFLKDWCLMFDAALTHDLHPVLELAMCSHACVHVDTSPWLALFTEHQAQTQSMV